jgi:hypothetical protein
MIQRIQSIYLVLVSVLSGGLVLIFDFWKNENNQSVDIWTLFEHQDYLLKSISIAFFLVALLAFISLMSFKHRILQINLNRFNILINLILLGLLVYHLLNLSGETMVSEKGIGSFLPLASIVLLLFANLAIQKDEKLVKSVDRLR